MIRFTGSAVSFPDDDIDPKKKEEKAFNLQVSQAVWSRFCNNLTFWGWDQGDFLATMRAYSDGRQSEATYKDWFVGAAKNSPELTLRNFARKGYANIDWTIVSYAPKIKWIIQAILASSDWKVQANSLNPSCVDEKAKMKWRLFFESKFGKQMRGAAGLPVRQSYWEPQNEQELELYEKLGGFKLEYETAIEDIAQHTFEISHWEDLREKFVSDLIDANFACGKQYTCENTGVTKIKHVAPRRLVMAWIDDQMEKAPNFIGHIEKVRLAEIRHTLQDLGYTEEQIRSYAKSTFPSSGNVNGWEYYDQRDPVTNMWRWYDMEVDVLEYEYLSCDLKYYTGREKKDGTYIYDVEPDRKKYGPYADGRKRKTDVISNLTIYKGKHIVGTDCVFDYGRQTNVPKKDKHTPLSSYFFVHVPGKSITERCRPFYDSMQQGWLKLQAAKWAAAPKGFAIDVAAIQNMNLGDGVLKPLEVIQIRRQNGVQLYKSVMTMGKVVSGANAIQELEGGIGKQATEWISMFEFDIQKILDLSGITEAVAASPAVSSEKGLGVSQLEIDSTNNALFPLKRAIVRLKEKAAHVIIAKTILNIRFDPVARKYYEGILGPAKINALLSVGDTTLEQLAIELESLPTKQEKEMILISANESKKAGKNGNIGIKESDYQFIVQLLNQDQYKLASWYLSLAEERDSAMKQAQALENTKAQSEFQTQQAMAVKQAELQIEQMKAQLEIQKHTAIANIDLMKEQKLKQLEGQTEIELQLIKGKQVLEQITLEATLESQFGNELSGKV